MPTTRLRLAAALVSLTALAACQDGGGGGGSRLVYVGGYQPIPYHPLPFYPMVIPTSRGFSCNHVGSTTYCN